MRAAARFCILLLLMVVLSVIHGGRDASGQEASSREESSGEETSQAESTPLDLGLREEAGVTLLILDVKVRDGNGNPVRGLTRDDFEVSINGRLWPLTAVDDFCTCSPATELDPGQVAVGENLQQAGEAVAGSTGSEPEGPPAVTSSGAVSDEHDASASEAITLPADTIRQHFVLYLDFSAFHHSGRVDAQRHAQRWIEEGMQTGDQVMLAGYSSAVGLVEITPFTADREVLLEGLAAAFADEALVDSFAVMLPRRLEDCDSCFKRCMAQAKQDQAGGAKEKCTLDCCYHYAREEASHGRRSLEALDLFVSTLADIPGPKQVIYFNQNTSIYPTQLYAGLRSGTAGVRNRQSWSIEDHMKLLGTLAGTATANRTAINVATMPAAMSLELKFGLSDEVGNLGWNVADFTGGVASRNRFDVEETMDRAGRECCLYRLSIEVPDNPPRSTLHAKVAVRGKMLNHSYRVRFYTPQERWFRNAHLALLTTSRSVDHEIQLALLPLARREGKWDVEAQVAFALQDLELQPVAGERTGRWRVGALLDRVDGHKSWEMLTLAEARLKGSGPTGLEALHSKVLERLNPGEYRLRAFVQDAEANRFWSREISLVLPAVGGKHGEGEWLSTPWTQVRSGNRLDLDLLPVSGKPPVPAVVADPAAGLVPLNDLEVTAGTPLEIHTLYCPDPEDAEEATAPATLSILMLNGRPLARLPDPGVEDVGECRVLTHTVDTTVLPPGEYVYRLMMTRGENEPLQRDVAMTIQAAAGP